MIDVKQEISDATGIPAELLTGDTPEENIARAKALLAYRSEATRPQTPAEQFAEWADKSGIWPKAPEGSAALDAIAERIRAEAGRGYPEIKDAGEAPDVPKRGTPEEQFTEWATRPRRIIWRGTRTNSPARGNYSRNK